MECVLASGVGSWHLVTFSSWTGASYHSFITTNKGKSKGKGRPSPIPETSVGVHSWSHSWAVSAELTEAYLTMLSPLLNLLICTVWSLFTPMVLARRLSSPSVEHPHLLIAHFAMHHLLFGINFLSHSTSLA